MKINKINKKLNEKPLFSVKDFKVTTFRCSGPGGQNVNKRNTGVRIVHISSGAIGESREERQQAQNKKIAFKRCINTKLFQDWLKFRSALELEGIKNFEKYIDNLLKEENLKIEVFKDGEWVEEK